jgi:hypothetical protein
MAADFRPGAAQTKVASDEAAAACANARDEFDDLSLDGGWREQIAMMFRGLIYAIAHFDRLWGIKGEFIRESRDINRLNEAGRDLRVF